MDTTKAIRRLTRIKHGKNLFLIVERNLFANHVENMSHHPGQIAHDGNRQQTVAIVADTHHRRTCFQQNGGAFLVTACHCVHQCSPTILVFLIHIGTIDTRQHVQHHLVQSTATARHQRRQSTARLHFDTRVMIQEYVDHVLIAFARRKQQRTKAILVDSVDFGAMLTQIFGKLVESAITRRHQQRSAIDGLDISRRACFQ
mmetsp:Transcript_55872/g.93046  ORF Transcript_55872/g.93046 Transcript_55872/m.93046 type:complete len:201 (-) Transcript_55872:52-654(-)